MSEAPTLRIVPGAPPPAPLSKSAKKKRRAALASTKGDEHDVESPVTNGHGLNSAVDAALVDHVPPTKELNSGLVAKPEEVANAAIASEAASEVASILPLPSKRPTSAVVELVNKRHRALNKKIQRIKEYASKPSDTLNDDQKRTLATLPALEASSKEVEEVRRAIEVHEAEEAANEARRLAEIEAIVKQRIADAVAETRATAVSRTVELVTVIRELRHLTEKVTENGSNPAQDLHAALYDDDDKSRLETMVGLFISGQGDYNLLVELLNAHQASTAQRTETPVQEEEPAPVAKEIPIGGVPNAATMGGSYHFMQESEIEPNTPFDEGAEWVEHQDAAPVPHNAPEAEPTEEDPANKAQGNIDWSAEHHEDLPPIAGLQEHFGASGQATPVAEAPAESANDWSVAGADSWVANTTDAAPKGKKDDDGFTTIPNKRGGGFGGDWRGGDRGRGRGYRGRGSGNWERKEGEGGRGGYRGGERGRGEYRGRARGDWKPREYRGRGEGRGGYRGRPTGEAAS